MNARGKPLRTLCRLRVRQHHGSWLSLRSKIEAEEGEVSHRCSHAHTTPEGRKLQNFAHGTPSHPATCVVAVPMHGRNRSDPAVSTHHSPNQRYRSSSRTSAFNSHCERSSGYPRSELNNSLRPGKVQKRKDRIKCIPPSEGDSTVELALQTY